MILISTYKGQHGGKKGKKIGTGVSPPPMPERKHFFYRMASLRANKVYNCKCIVKVLHKYCTSTVKIIKVEPIASIV